MAQTVRIGLQCRYYSLIPGWEYALEKGIAALTCSFLENSLNREGWQVTVHGITRRVNHGENLQIGQWVRL